MKKRMISLVLAMVLALSLAISASAAESNPTYISEELYTAYEALTEKVSQERNIPLEICPLSEMTEVRSLDEFEADLEELCDVITEMKSPDSSIVTMSNSNTNPSAGGQGTKNLTVNITKNLNNGYFLWTMHGTAVIVTNGPLPYNFSRATISELSLIKRPTSYTFRTTSAPKVTSSTSSLWIVSQPIEVQKNGTAAGSFSAVANFNLNTKTGVVTMTGKMV